MKRIAFFQEDMGMGGIQKSLHNLLLNLDYEDLCVDLYLFAHEDFWDQSNDASKVFPDNVTVRYIELKQKINKYLPFDIAMSRLTPAITAAFPPDTYYDVAIDFNSYQPECAAGAILAPAGRRVEWVHNDIAIKLENEWKYRVLHHFFRGKFKYFDEFICVSQGIVEPFKKSNASYLNPDAVVNVIQNYIDVDEINMKKDIPIDDLAISADAFNLVTTGRLCHQKGFDIMLKALSDAERLRSVLTAGDPEDYPEINMYFIGDGPDKDKLEKLAREYRLIGDDSKSDRVFFLGRKNNPFNYMNSMDAFISTSRYEGQAMNIMEAKAIGLPLYCTRNLEPYVEKLKGYDNISEALAYAKKEKKRPDSLYEYNKKIIASVVGLAR